jgi:hypothetical protein
MKLNLPYRTGTVRVASPYGMRTISGVREMHKGVDLVGSDKTIVAPCDGKIGWAGEYNDKLRGGNTWEWGKYIRIETEDGYKIYLCHMAAVAVKAGQAVKAGDVLGREGTTGKSTGSHCHFEVRYGGKSTDPTPMLGIANRAGSYPAVDEDTVPDDYTVGGLRFVRCRNPRLVYLDAAKSKMTGRNACNADFFGNYKRGKTAYTLPVGNLVCDMGSYQVPEDVKQDISRYINAGKLRYSAADNAADSALRWKNVSTLIVPKSGKPYIADIHQVPEDAKYAVSGVPCVRSGDDVDWHRYVAVQGWGADTVRNTYHNWLGVRDGEVWLITGQSKAKSGNMIYGMWFWNLVKDEGFDDIIKLDGGGSYYCRIGGKVLPGSLGTRRINAYFTWE